jgi:hypothetical protein
MSSLNEHDRIDAQLRSHERKFSLSASDHERRAEEIRTKKHRELGQHIGLPDEARGRLESSYDARIRHHERQGAIHRRRATVARAGYLHHGPDEGRDTEYMRDHHELIEMARRTGRLRQTDEPLDLD